MTEGYNVVVVGGGHNSLITAAYLAKAGLRVIMLEAREVIGGDTVTEELTVPGFMHDSCSSAHAPALRRARTNSMSHCRAGRF